jgi:hypothetical protein
MLPLRSVLAVFDKTENVEVETTYGRIRGLKTDALSTFKGIPCGGSIIDAKAAVVGDEVKLSVDLEVAKQ